MPGSPLDDWNVTDLVQLGRELGLGSVEAPSREVLIEMLEGDRPPVPDALSAHRARMEAHIQRNWERLRTQLPGCDGRCTTYGCPQATVMDCFLGMKRDL